MVAEYAGMGLNFEEIYNKVSNKLKMDATAESPYFYDDGYTKARLVHLGGDYYRAETKRSGTTDEWEGGLMGTADFLGLTERDIKWAKKK